MSSVHPVRPRRRSQKPGITPTDFSIVNQPGAGSYPISGYSWALAYARQPAQATGQALVALWTRSPMTARPTPPRTATCPCTAQVRRLAPHHAPADHRPRRDTPPRLTVPGLRRELQASPSGGWCRQARSQAVRGRGGRRSLRPGPRRPRSAHAPAQTGRQRVQASPVRARTRGRPGDTRPLRAPAGTRRGRRQPTDARAACRALGVPELDHHQHTELFVLNCPRTLRSTLAPTALLAAGAPTGSGASSVSARLPSPITCPPCSAFTPAWARRRPMTLTSPPCNRRRPPPRARRRCCRSTCGRGCRPTSTPRSTSRCRQ